MIKTPSQILLAKIRTLIRDLRTIRSGVSIDIMSIPSRIDHGSYVYSRSKSANNRLRCICQKERVNMIDLSISKSHLNFDGVHYNKRGALLAGRKVVQLAENFFANATSPFLE